MSEDKQVLTTGTFPTVIFPSDAGHIDVTAHGADKTGVHDSTAAINAIIASYQPSGSKQLVLYYPSGTYLISGTLSSYQNGSWYCATTHQGENINNTTIKCADSTWTTASNYTPSTAAPKHCMIAVGSQLYNGSGNNGGGNQAFNNYIYDLSLNLGNNPGGGAIAFGGSNAAAVKRVTITCTSGYCGLDLNVPNNGPLFVQDVNISGNFTIPCDGGDNEEYSIVMERVTIGRGSGTTSFTQNGLMISIKDSTFAQGAVNAGNVGAISYWNCPVAAAATTNTAGGWVNNFGPGLGGYKITPPDTPQVPWDNNMSNWANAATMGWQAALNSGATTVYWPLGNFPTNSTGGYSIPITVSRIILMGSGFNITASGTFFTTTGTTSNPLVIERAWYTGPSSDTTGFVNHQSNRDLIISDWDGDGTVNTTTGVSGRVFFDNTASLRISLASGCFFYARQFNWEDGGMTAIANNGGTAWMLGLKTERSANSPIITATGGRTEMLGGYNYPGTTPPVSTSLVPYTFTNASFAVQWITTNFGGGDYTTNVTLNGSASGFTEFKTGRGSGTYGTASNSYNGG